MISDGPLAAGVVAMQAAPLAVKRSALRRTRLADAVTQSQRIRIVDGYERVFTDSVGGFSVPLVASGEMFGVLNVEYPAPAGSGGGRRAGHDPARQSALGGAAQPQPPRRGALLPRLSAQDDRRRQRAHHRHRSRRQRRRDEQDDAELPRLRPRRHRHAARGDPQALDRARAAPVDAAPGRTARHRVQRLRGRAVAAQRRHARARACSTPRPCARPTAASTGSSASARTSSACARSSGRSSRRRSWRRSGSSPPAWSTSSTIR